MSCKEDTCGGKKMNARCVDYEGKVSKCSGTEDKCNKRTVHEVLEDNSQQLTEICRQLDMSDLTPGCLEVEVSKPEVKDYMQAIIDKLCDPKFDCEKLFNTSLECSGLDYKCFVNECEEEFKPSNLTELFQMLIDRSCNNGEGCNCETDKRVFYFEDRSGLTSEETIGLGGEGYKALNYRYTITPQDGDGMYELMFHSGLYSVLDDTGAPFKYGIFINDTLYDITGAQSVNINIKELEKFGVVTINLSTSWFQSNIPLVVGDTIGMYVSDKQIAIQNSNILIKKIAQ